MAQSQADSWHPFEFLVGTWKGVGGGEPGIGDYERTYQFIFNKTFLQVTNQSTYPPNEQNPRGEVHQDIGYISYDRSRQTFVLRQFHTEGFVNQYVLDSMSEDGMNFVFVTEAIENIQVGWRARETYQVTSDSEFTETFELAAPGSDFEVYTMVVLRK